jgi:CheY-like chemotaxis protein
MFYKYWEILLVDDDPDILNVSKLAMRNFEVYGLPLKLHTAASKAEAMEILGDMAGELPRPAVALIDVVMETEEAGLELCRYIRDEQNNKLTQLFIRTGQPGIAPERSVIDTYDINGYFTKVEATEDKLYTMIKSGIRQYLWSAMSIWTILLLTEKIEALASGSSVSTSNAPYREMYGNLHDIAEPQICSMIGDRVLSIIGMDEQTAHHIRHELEQLPSIQVDSHGRYYRAGNKVLVQFAPQPGQPEFSVVSQTMMTVPDNLMKMWYHSVLGRTGLIGIERRLATARS